MRHNRYRRPYELRICDKRDWHSVQDEEHILLDCPHEHLVSVCTKHRQLVFPPQTEDSLTRLRTFLNQLDIHGVAPFVAECPFPLIYSSTFFGLVSGLSQASAQMPPRGIYSDVTLPYLTYVAPSLNHAGCVITTSRIFSFLLLFFMYVAGRDQSAAADQPNNLVVGHPQPPLY